MSSTAQKTDQQSTLIDCDVHQAWVSEEEVVAYLPEEFQDRGLTAPSGQGWANPVTEHGIARNDAVPEEGPGGSSHELLEEQLFDDFGVDYAVLTGPITNYDLAVHPNVHYAKAAMEAYNDWQVAEWLEQDERFLGSIMVAPHAPDHARKEIERLGAHDQIVQVLLPGAHESPYGHQKYWPIYEAAHEAGLTIGLHSSTASKGVAQQPSTGAGVPLSYFEMHAATRAVQMGQLISIVSEGVFVEYPDLDWVFLEQCLGWIPHVLWTMDQNWKGLKDAVPWLERRPSEYIRDNVWFSTQPSIDPDDPEHLPQFFDMIHADETLVFSSDYPHWDNDNPKAILRGIDDETNRAILSENAKSVYRL
ncbi:amidohydrolase family protein [Salinadaptatus halalkaliphilus]|nr:amidohydrolase family protein [Salinadaptatus halalkaliphilus]